MRILFAVDMYLPQVSGAALAPYQIASQLAKQGHQVLVIAPALEQVESEKEEPCGNHSVYRISSYPIPFITSANYIRISPVTYNKIRKIIKQFRPDIVHTHHISFIGFSALQVARQEGLPIVGTNYMMPENIIHNMGYIRNLARLSNQIEKLIWKQLVYFYNRCDVVVSPNSFATEVLRSHGLTSPTEEISYGVNRKIFKRQKKLVSLYTQFTIPAQIPIILFVGRLDGDKNIELIINAAKRLFAENSCHFVIAGKGHLQEKFTLLAKSSGLVKNMTFTGYVSEAMLPHLYNLADMFVMPSPNELQSLATLEAMASGLPILAVHSGALPQVIRQGENGLLFEKDNDYELSEYIRLLLHNKRMAADFGRRSIELAAEHDIDTVAVRYTNVYSRMK